MSKIERNKNPAGRTNNMVFGLCQLADGFVRVVSFGFLHTRFPIDQARNVAHKQLEKLKKQK